MTTATRIKTAPENDWIASLLGVASASPTLVGRLFRAIETETLGSSVQWTVSTKEGWMWDEKSTETPSPARVTVLIDLGRPGLPVTVGGHSLGMLTDKPIGDYTTARDLIQKGWPAILDRCALVADGREDEITPLPMKLIAGALLLDAIVKATDLSDLWSHNDEAASIAAEKACEDNGIAFPESFDRRAFVSIVAEMAVSGRRPTSACIERFSRGLAAIAAEAAA